MVRSLKRPEPPVGAGPGLMRKEQFQTAYVTSDLDAACSLLAERYGIENFFRSEGEIKEGGRVRVAFAWVGGTMCEIIEAKGGREVDFYNDRLPDEGFGLVFHHLGYLIHSREEWDALKAEICDRNMPVSFYAEDPGRLEAIYIEAPELGHYLEYIFPEDEGIAFFEAIPAN